MPARINESGTVRWCLCCDTVLPLGGRSPLCEVHRVGHRALRRQRTALARRDTIPLSRVAVEHVHHLADLIERDLGALTVAYNAGSNLRLEMDRAMLDSKRLIRYLRENLPDPRVEA